jgi:hypothetical protein
MLASVAGCAPPAVEGPEEVLVVDARAGLSPAQMVERKLMGMLRTVPLPVSQIMTRPGRRL